jgi:hypothetical protein
MPRSISLVLLSAFCLVSVPMVTHGQEVMNLVQNPSFEEDEVILNDPAWANWYTWGDQLGVNSTVAFDETEFIDGKRSLRIEPKGAVNWHFIVVNDGNAVNTGKEYTVSFWAKAEDDRPIAAKLKATDNSVDFCETDLGLITTEWSEYKFTCEPTKNEIKLEIFCAGSDVPFWLDFVYLYEGDYVEGILPSEFAPEEVVQPAGKLTVTWADIKMSH